MDVHENHASAKSRPPIVGATIILHPPEPLARHSAAILVPAPDPLTRYGAATTLGPSLVLHVRRGKLDRLNFAVVEPYWRAGHAIILRFDDARDAEAWRCRQEKAPQIAAAVR